MPKISAVICVKDQKYELKKSLRSIFSQSLPPDEIIIVDASCDDSIRNFVKNDLSGKEKYISLNAMEAAGYDERALFEIGLKNAECDFAAFLVAGDEWMDGKIECVKNLSFQNPDAVFFVSSFFQRARLSDLEIHADELCYNSDGLDALFFLWFAPSAVVVKRTAFFALSAFSAQEIGSLKPCFIPQFLSMNYYGAQKDLLLMERFFWRANYDKILKLKIIKRTVAFCVRLFHDSDVSKESLEAFAKNVELPLEMAFEIAELLPEVCAIQEAKIQANKNRQNYLLMRSWLEMEVSGRSVSDNLSKRGFSSVVIYGAGKHGGILFDDLQKSKVKILACIDKSSAKKDFHGLPVYTLQDLSNASLAAELFTACVIVTPYLEFDSISKELENLGFKNIVSIKDIVQ